MRKGGMEWWGCGWFGFAYRDSNARLVVWFHEILAGDGEEGLIRALIHGRLVPWPWNCLIFGNRSTR